MNAVKSLICWHLALTLVWTFVVGCVQESALHERNDRMIADKLDVLNKSIHSKTRACLQARDTVAESRGWMRWLRETGHFFFYDFRDRSPVIARLDPVAASHTQPPKIIINLPATTVPQTQPVAVTQTQSVLPPPPTVPAASSDLKDIAKKLKVIGKNINGLKPSSSPFATSWFGSCAGAIAGAIASIIFAALLAQWNARKDYTKAMLAEFNSKEMNYARTAADSFLVKYHEDKQITFGLLYKAYPLETGPIWVLTSFFERLQKALEHKWINEKEVGPMFGEIFCWWYLSYFKDKLSPEKWESSKLIDDLHKWMENQGDYNKWKVSHQNYWINRNDMNARKVVINQIKDIEQRSRYLKLVARAHWIERGSPIGDQDTDWFWACNQLGVQA